MTNLAKAMLDGGFSVEHTERACAALADILVDCSILSVDHTNEFIRECNKALAERSKK